MPLTRPVRACSGTDDDRRWHAAHGNGVRCRVCWPDPVGVRLTEEQKEHSGLPPMPPETTRYPAPDVDWRAEMLRAGFDDDIPAEVA